VPVVEPVTEPVAAPEPVTAPVAVTEPVTEPVAVTEPVTEPVLTAPDDLDDIELEPMPTQAADPAADTAPVADDDSPTAGVLPAPTVAPARSVKEALALAKQGHRDAAIAGLRLLWRKQPKNAQLPYVLGNLYSDQRWWTVAMQHYQAAIARSKAYRSNPTIIRNVIGALASGKTRAKATWFLRSLIGSPARRYLQAAAKHHASAEVRRRSAVVLKRL